MKKHFTVIFTIINATYLHFTVSIPFGWAVNTRDLVVPGSSVILKISNLEYLPKYWPNKKKLENIHPKMLLFRFCWYVLNLYGFLFLVKNSIYTRQVWGGWIGKDMYEACTYVWDRYMEQVFESPSWAQQKSPCTSKIKGAPHLIVQPLFTLVER